MHAPHPTILYPLYPPLAISYRNHQKSLAYFSHLAPLILFFLLKGAIKRGAWPNRTQTHFRRHEHTAKENERYRSSAVKLASCSRTPRSLFSHPQEVRAPPIGNRCFRHTVSCENIFVSSRVTALTVCPFSLKKCAEMSAFLCENRPPLPALPPHPRLCPPPLPNSGCASV